MKLFHVMFLVAAAIGGLYIFHMVTQHQGSQIQPGVGINQKLP